MDRYFEELNVHLHTEQMGDDLCVSVYGGDLPHIGSIAVADPRESLNGDGTSSATVSTFNFTGHKDSEVANVIAHAVASRLHCRVVVVCGLHFDQINEDLFQKIKDLSADIIRTIC